MLRLVDRFNETDIQEVFRIVDECYPNDGYSPAAVRKIMMKYPAWFIDDGGIRASLISEIQKGQPYVWSVCTRESHRGHGYATTLLKAFEAHYAEAGHHKMWLQVRATNPAQKLYFDLGYRVSAFESHLYGAQQHGLVMRKSI